MTFDERLHRLTERHEALTQTVELLARQMVETNLQVQAINKQLQTIGGFVTDIAEGTARLLHIAEIHERRISPLGRHGLI
jgi:uncharacterized HAD superfamily protein